VGELLVWAIEQASFVSRTIIVSVIVGWTIAHAQFILEILVEIIGAIEGAAGFLKVVI
jgi:uncharacterized protein (DUF486 family)